ncbi:brix domain-containing protein [Sodiomyces alkalinus F11]|uniref:Ribosome production factor 2 homolog n=1 Tax=Sodiomyces alkalinus (strain CBS 110278 / VKM F-3762 / F11) TaxID=1314773 RepID=A0A3N2Q4C5_SODAK|nr:brix domain-containing protein [Sodiomyces alkalinus F11]ROT41566.1 brix domain-containing protein [Sodiomyces alkalinus F11]
MLRQIKPRNARSKRALEKMQPKVVENPKTALFLRGTKCSQVVMDAMNDLYAMRLPFAKKFSKKNDIAPPFESVQSFEFFSEKNDASLLLFGTTSKKRPHMITFVRTFGHKVLDMLELHVDPDTFRSLNQFNGKKFTVGQRPMVVFSGTAWDSPVANEYTMAKSLLTDFFCNRDQADAIDVEGLQYIVSLAVEEESSASESNGSGSSSKAKPRIRLRVYTIRTKRSGGRLPRVEVDEIGPRMDFRVGRMQPPDEDMLKEAMRNPKGTEERTKKNITTDALGYKIGRVHLGRQDLSQLQTRKLKGLKRSRDVASDDGMEDIVDDEEPKRSKK